MATDTRNLPAFLSDDATFRTWGSGIAAQIAAMGLVQTSDTGQINWATVARPSTFAYAGYEIWRFNDALQATKPVFIRLDYGIGGTADRPAMIARVATATNGAGTLTGQVGTTTTGLLPGGSKTAGSTLPSFCSGSTSRLNLFTHVESGGGAGTFGFMVWVERTKTSLGVNTGDGIATWVASWNGVQYQAIPFAGTIPAVAAMNPAITLISSSGAISSIGPNVAFSPTIVCLGKAYFASWAVYVDANISKLMPISIDHLGATHTLMPLGDTALVSGSMNYAQPTSAGLSFAILWE